MKNLYLIAFAFLFGISCENRGHISSQSKSNAGPCSKYLGNWNSRSDAIVVSSKNGQFVVTLVGQFNGSTGDFIAKCINEELVLSNPIGMGDMTIAIENSTNEILFMGQRYRKN